MPGFVQQENSESLLQLLRDDTFIVPLLAQITGQPEAQVTWRLNQEQAQLGFNVNKEFEQRGLAPYQWSPQLVEFYQQTDAFLYESLIWNRHWLKTRQQSWIRNYLQRDGRPLKVLTFGDGLGIDSGYLALAGHEVDYFEVSERCVQFARALNRHAQAGFKLHQHLEEIPQESYDCVVCLDVLEHVPDPPAVTEKLAAFLKPGGRLIVHAPFWYIHPAVPTHLVTNLQYSGDLKRLYEAHGLKLIEALPLWSPIVLLKPTCEGLPKLPLSQRLNMRTHQLWLWLARYWYWPHVWNSRRLLSKAKQPNW